MKSILIGFMTWLSLFFPPVWGGIKAFDLVIEHGTILTMNRTDQCIEDGVILISDGRIQEINQWHDGVRKLSVKKPIWLSWISGNPIWRRLMIHSRSRCTA